MGDLSHRYPPSFTRRPPGMPEGDFDVWRIYLAQFRPTWDEYAYDVELHGGPTPIADADPALAKGWARLTAKRIDVVGFRQGIATLIEVRTAAAWQSLGQIMGYLQMFPIDYPAVPLEGGIIITDRMDQQIKASCQKYGIGVFEVHT